MDTIKLRELSNQIEQYLNSKDEELTMLFDEHKHLQDLLAKKERNQTNMITEYRSIVSQTDLTTSYIHNLHFDKDTLRAIIMNSVILSDIQHTIADIVISSNVYTEIYNCRKSAPTKCLIVDNHNNILDSIKSINSEIYLDNLKFYYYLQWSYINRYIPRRFFSFQSRSFDTRGALIITSIFNFYKLVIEYITTTC